MQQKIPTLDDVAALSGYSTATVSRCLSEPQKVAHETRRKVEAAIDQLGYVPNSAARALAANRSRLIGAVVPTMENAIFAKGVQAFQEEVEKSGCNLLIASSSYRADKERQAIRELVSRGVDGILLIGEERDPEVYNFLQLHGVPYVLAWCYGQNETHSYVGFDNHISARSIADLVTGKGHRRVAIISGHREGNDRAAQRVSGFLEALEQADIEPDTVPIIECNYSLDSGGMAFEAHVKAHPDLTAILCGNDILAIGALTRARRMGIGVPGDISVTGFDNIEMSGVVEPPLTTVDVAHRKMGTLAARQLLRPAEDETNGRGHRLDTNVVVRASLGPARNGNP